MHNSITINSNDKRVNDVQIKWHGWFQQNANACSFDDGGALAALLNAWISLFILLMPRLELNDVSCNILIETTIEWQSILNRIGGPTFPYVNMRTIVD